MSMSPSFCQAVLVRGDSGEDLSAATLVPVSQVWLKGQVGCLGGEATWSEAGEAFVPV